MRQWRLIYDQPTTGARNMAIDEAILTAVSQGNAPPTLRLYAWNPPCLSLGYGQQVSDADLSRIMARGWQIVRRATGGKAILHTDELTYSVALPNHHPLAQGSIVESYRHLSNALMWAVESLGLHAQSLPKEPGTSGSGAVCFEVPSHYEITADGKKLIGSAQMRRKNGLLQHGSIPLAGDLARICDALAYPDETTRERARVKVYQRATTLRDALDHPVTWDAAADAVALGFKTVFDLDFGTEPGALTAAEQQHVAELAATRYATIDKLSLQQR